MLLIVFFMCSLLGLAQQKYEIVVSKKLVLSSLEIAKKYVGITENKANRHPLIDQFNLCIGNPIGSPYCQAGQYYSYYEAYKIHYKSTYNGHPVPRNGLAISTFYYAKKVGQKVKYRASTHDFIVWKHKNGTFGHIERIVQVLPKGWVVTLGFNVSSNNKEGIFYKKRNINMPLNRIKNILGLVGVKYDT